jgi:hypothetical protein
VTRSSKITTTIKYISLLFPKVTQTNHPNTQYQIKYTQLIIPSNIHFLSLTNDPKAQIVANINFPSLTYDPTAQLLRIKPHPHFPGAPWPNNQDERRRYEEKKGRPRGNRGVAPLLSLNPNPSHTPLRSSHYRPVLPMEAPDAGLPGPHALPPRRRRDAADGRATG